MSCHKQVQETYTVLHFSDNSKIDDVENKKNKLYKIQPVIDHGRNNCTIKPEIENSIDEQIIPAKIKYSGNYAV